MIQTRYLIVRRYGRPPQVLRLSSTSAECRDIATDLYADDAHSVSICVEESRMGSEPAGARDYQEY